MPLILRRPGTQDTCGDTHRIRNTESLDPVRQRHSRSARPSRQRRRRSDYPGRRFWISGSMRASTQTTARGNRLVLAS